MILNRKIWFNVLPIRQWMELLNSLGDSEVVFMLPTYSVVDGVTQYEIKIRDGATL